MQSIHNWVQKLSTSTRDYLKYSVAENDKKKQIIHLRASGKLFDDKWFNCCTSG